MTLIAIALLIFLLGILIDIILWQKKEIKILREENKTYKKYFS